MSASRNPLDILAALMRANIETLKTTDRAFSDGLEVAPPEARELRRRSLAERLSIASIRQTLKHVERALLRRDARRRLLKRLRTAVKSLVRRR